MTPAKTVLDKTRSYLVDVVAICVSVSGLVGVPAFGWIYKVSERVTKVEEGSRFTEGKQKEQDAATERVRLEVREELRLLNDKVDRIREVLERRR